MKSAPVLVTLVFALAFGGAQAQQKEQQGAARSKAAQDKTATERAAGRKAAAPKALLSPPEFAEARLAYCKGHEALGALGFLRHGQDRDVDALPLVIQRDFRDMRGADLRMRIWTLNYGMNVAASEQEAKRGAFRHCMDGFGPVLEQMRYGPLR